MDEAVTSLANDVIVSYVDDVIETGLEEKQADPDHVIFSNVCGALRYRL